ncbi:MAG TPA: ATPase domain-containing protein [Anaeromyxobacteraceae bacterium]|nr:ATPase domain-containing protein [Anaeromyxobacteraceae bacterium]
MSELAMAHGILWLRSALQDFARLRELEVKKLQGWAFVSGIHFFGSDELEALLAGGFPQGSAITLLRGAGTGKTSLGLHSSAEGARRRAAGVLFPLEKTSHQLKEIAAALPFGLVALLCAPCTDLFPCEALDRLTRIALGAVSERYEERAYAPVKHMQVLGVALVMTMETREMLGSLRLSRCGISFATDDLVQRRYVEMDGRLERVVSVIRPAGGRRHRGFAT